MLWILFVTLWCTLLGTEGWLFMPSPNQVCYGSLGCFSGDRPYTNTPGLLPRSPAAIGTKFVLFTRNSVRRQQELQITDGKGRCSWRTFCPRQETKMIIHGYHHHSRTPWVRTMARELLKKENYNVILVDWKRGAREINYRQSVANIRVVGTQVAQLLRIIQRSYNYDLQQLHIIGHSLGAHAAGYAGEYVTGIGRITGLDPAGPSFEGEDPGVRLDPSDANFVDVIHTDGEHLFQLGFGLKMPLGTVDFYPNGGMDQPGCPSTYMAQLGLIIRGNLEFVENFACSHLRALDLFTESINSNCTFYAYPCGVINSRSADECVSCDPACGIMGLYTKSSTPSGKYYIPTNSEAPYCYSEPDAV